MPYIYSLTRARNGRASSSLAASLCAIALLLQAGATKVSAEPASAPDRMPGVSNELTVVGSFNDYNEVFRGTAKRDPGGWFVVKLKGDVNNVECEGKGTIVYDAKRDDCEGNIGIGRLRCADERVVQAETRWTACNRAVSTGFDQFGNKLTFISGHTAEVADKLFAAEREAASKRPALAYAPQKTRKKRGYVTGTGFFVSDRGHVLANYRLVDGATEITVVDSKGAEFPARVVKKDQTYDVVLLKTDATAPKLTVRDDDGLARGTKVYTIGYPLIAVVRQKQHLTFGTVATSKDVIADERFMQLDLPVRAGNAGGPLLDETGAVVGMVTTPLDPASAAEGRGAVGYNVGYALKSRHLAALLEPAQQKFGTAGAPPASPAKQADIMAAAEPSIVLVIAR